MRRAHSHQAADHVALAHLHVSRTARFISRCRADAAWPIPRRDWCRENSTAPPRSYSKIMRAAAGMIAAAGMALSRKMWCRRSRAICLAAAMIRLEAAGYPVVLHCHDECVCEVPAAAARSRQIPGAPDRIAGLGGRPADRRQSLERPTLRKNRSARATRKCSYTAANQWRKSTRRDTGPPR